MNKRGISKIFIIILITIIIIALISIYTYKNYLEGHIFTSARPITEIAIHWIEDGQDIYCIDSDNGEDIYVQGTLNLYDKKGKPIKDLNGEIYLDFCFNDNKIQEYSCTPYDIDNLLNCSKGCKDGACIK